MKHTPCGIRPGAWRASNALGWCLLLLLAGAARAEVRLPRLIGDRMVLQRDAPLTIWGWGRKGETVRVTFRGRSYRTRAGNDGTWALALPPQAAGGPDSLEVRGDNRIALRDVLVGDVWLGAGQSNMEWPLEKNVLNFEEEIRRADFPAIRLFDVADAVALTPQTDVKSAGWKRCSPQTIGPFSAVAYFFGRALHRQYGVPIGLITSDWGGTPAEAWASADALKTLPDFKHAVEQLVRRNGDLVGFTGDYPANLAAWQHAFRHLDAGLGAAGPSWAHPSADASAWPTMPVPIHWEDSGALPDFDGVVWFRREIDIPEADAGKPLTLRLGKIDDADSTWFNGRNIGGTSGYDTPRTYTAPGHLVVPGRNVLAVRVLDLNGGGGIWGPPEDVYAQIGDRRVNLAGTWAYRVGVDTRPLNLPRPPVRIFNQNAPTALFNAMIHPLRTFAIKGVIWYQGEANAERAAQYRTLFKTLIQDWRNQWGRDFPFLFVQLAAFMRDQPEPADCAWAELREAQCQALALPRTGMAVAIDVGDPDDIHPRNKQAVGERLALAARAVAYGENLVHSGPRYRAMRVEGRKIRLTFSDLGSGLRVDDGQGGLRGFAVAGTDRKFAWARATVEGSDVVVQSDAVPDPVAVRYNWGNSPDGNLYNREGLPAVPFRTDNWPGLTEHRR